MGSSTYPEVTVRAECIRRGCTKRMARMSEFEQRVPWYLIALPVLRVHVGHGSCPLRISLDGEEHVGRSTGVV